VRVRPRPGDPARSKAGSVSGVLAGARLVAGNPALRTPMLLGWLAAFYDVPEGVAAPLARMLGGGSATVGLLLASTALGSVLGSLAFSRLVDPLARLRWTGPLAVLSTAVLAAFYLSPQLPFALLILIASGVFSCYQLAANAAFVSAAPPAQRSQAFGLAQGGMNLGQGTFMLLAGAGAEHFAPAVVIASAGVTGTIAATVVAFSWTRRQ
jgi:predicted MFS family arabinose efflux permease